MTNRISEIKAKIGAGARSNKFMVYFSFPQGLDVSSTGLENDAAILCHASAIPGRAVAAVVGDLPLFSPLCFCLSPPFSPLCVSVPPHSFHHSVFLSLPTLITYL